MMRHVLQLKRRRLPDVALRIDDRRIGGAIQIVGRMFHVVNRLIHVGRSCMSKLLSIMLRLAVSMSIATARSKQGLHR